MMKKILIYILIFVLGITNVYAESVSSPITNMKLGNNIKYGGLNNKDLFFYYDVDSKKIYGVSIPDNNKFLVKDFSNVSQDFKDFAIVGNYIYFILLSGRSNYLYKDTWKSDDGIILSTVNLYKRIVILSQTANTTYNSKMIECSYDEQICMLNDIGVHSNYHKGYVYAFKPGVLEDEGYEQSTFVKSDLQENLTIPRQYSIVKGNNKYCFILNMMEYNNYYDYQYYYCIDNTSNFSYSRSDRLREGQPYGIYSYTDLEGNAHSVYKKYDNDPNTNQGDLAIDRNINTLTEEPFEFPIGVDEELFFSGLMDIEGNKIYATYNFNDFKIRVYKNGVLRYEKFKKMADSFSSSYKIKLTIPLGRYDYILYYLYYDYDLSEVVKELYYEPNTLEIIEGGGDNQSNQSTGTGGEDLLNNVGAEVVEAFEVFVPKIDFIRDRVICNFDISYTGSTDVPLVCTTECNTDEGISLCNQCFNGGILKEQLDTLKDSCGLTNTGSSILKSGLEIEGNYGDLFAVFSEENIKGCKAEGDTLNCGEFEFSLDYIFCYINTGVESMKKMFTNLFKILNLFSGYGNSNDYDLSTYLVFKSNIEEYNGYMKNGNITKMQEIELEIFKLMFRSIDVILFILLAWWNIRFIRDKLKNLDY